MCWLSKLFKKVKPLTLPHPEEMVNPSATVDNTDIKGVIAKWLSDWQVPERYHSFWATVSVQLSLQYTYPAATISETKQIWVRPEWANPGVLAHEMAHIGYSLLDDAWKSDFEQAYGKILGTDALLKLLYSQKPYMETNIVEAHADTYRYLGDKMPEVLKTYYPNMF